MSLNKLIVLVVIVCVCVSTVSARITFGTDFKRKKESLLSGKETGGHFGFDHFAFTRTVPTPGSYDEGSPEPTSTYWGFRQDTFDISTLSVGPKDIWLAFPDQDVLPSLELESFIDAELYLYPTFSRDDENDVECFAKTRSTNKKNRQIILGQITCRKYSDNNINWNLLEDFVVIFHPTTKTSDGNMPLYSFDKFCGSIQVDRAAPQSGCSYVTAHAVIEGIEKFQNKALTRGIHGTAYNMTTTVTITSDKTNKWGFARFWEHQNKIFFIEAELVEDAVVQIPTCVISTVQAPEKKKPLVVTPQRYIVDGQYQFYAELSSASYPKESDLIVSCVTVGEVPFYSIRMGTFDVLPTQPREITQFPENYSFYNFHF
jgi:hypothetical protein